MPIALVEGQDASGEFNATSGPATLPAGTTAGNTVILVVDTDAAAITTPTGFVKDNPTVTQTNKIAVFRRSNVPADETSWTVTISAVRGCAWRVREYEGIDNDFPVDAVPASTQGSSSASSLTAGPTPTNNAYDGLLLVAFGANSPDTTPPTWSGHTGGLVETAAQQGVGTSTSVGLSVGTRPVASLAAWSVQATCSLTTVVTSAIVVYAAQGAKRQSRPENIWGFEWLTTTAMTNGGGTVGTKLFETATGAPEVVDDATKARTGNGYLRLSSTSAAENVTDAERNVLAGASKAIVQRRCVRFDGGLPSVDTELFAVTPSTGGGTTIVRFVAASSKLGCKVGTGTEILSDATVAADVWIGVDVRLNCNTTAHTCDWQVDYDATPGDATGPVAQTQASFTASTTPTAYITRLGWTAAITPGVPVLYDDCVDSVVAAAYPLGDHRIRLLKVDQAATPTISGTAANFNQFTANGTMAAFAGDTAKTYLDEVPPTIGGSADGIAQVTAATSDYVNLPMETFQAAPAETIRAVKLLAIGWAASGTAATLGFRFHDGSTEYVLHAGTLDPAFDNSTTTAWVCGMCRPSTGWSQAQLDALAFRMGFSSDATPDIGVNAVYGELCTQVTRVDPLFGAAGALPRVERRSDPSSEGIIALDTYTTADQALEITYDIGGTPTTYTAPADSGPHTQTIDAPDFPTVISVTARPL